MAIDPAAAEHHALVRAVANMRVEPAAAAQLEALGLHLTQVCWEDCARYENSAVGPNISDMTIEVESVKQGQRFATCMPVLRYPNFSDHSADVPLDALRVQVGNERGEPLRTVGLREYLGDLRSWLHAPDSWAGAGRSLLAARDSHALVSAQACLLPVPRAGLATFTPVIFNYQSRVGAPAVLAILATREGTSATVVDYRRDNARFRRQPGQRLLFNANGQRAPFTGARASENLAPGTGRAAARAASMVLLIQVPLRQPPPPPDRFAHMEIFPHEMERGDSTIEPAVIGHGAVEGRFIEIDRLAIERDDRFPIRVTVQFYQATCEPELDEDALVELGAQIERVYADADAVGSLVCDGAGGRVTAWDDEGAGKRQPPGWWGAFWRRYAADHGLAVAEALEQWVRGQEDWPGSPDALARSIAGLRRDQS